MKATRRSRRSPKKRSLIFDSANSGIGTASSEQPYLNFIIDLFDRTIVHSWISFRAPDAHQLLEELKRFASRDVG